MFLEGFRGISKKGDDCKEKRITGYHWKKLKSFFNYCMEKEYKEEASLFSTILAEQNSKEQMVCVKAG